MPIFVGQNREPSIIRKNIKFPGYRELPVPADENLCRIWILQVKKKKKKKKKIDSIINLNFQYPEKFG